MPRSRAGRVGATSSHGSGAAPTVPLDVRASREYNRIDVNPRTLPPTRRRGRSLSPTPRAHPARLDHDGRPGTASPPLGRRYKVVHDATVRSTPEADSQKVGKHRAGTIIDVVQQSTNSDGLAVLQTNTPPAVTQSVAVDGESANGSGSRSSAKEPSGTGFCMGLGLWCDRILQCCFTRRPYARMELVPQESSPCPSQQLVVTHQASPMVVTHKASPGEGNVWICHMCRGRRFYRRRGDDASVTLRQPVGASIQTKQEITDADAAWFDERWAKLTQGAKDQVALHAKGAKSQVALHATQPGNQVTVQGSPGRNMLAVAHDEFAQHRARVGYLIAGNAGKLGGGLHNNKNYGKGEGWNVEKNPCCQKDPQEENSFRNFWHASKPGHVEQLMTRQLPNWGMLDFKGTDHSTRQGVDYTMRASHGSSDQARSKYSRCLRVGNVEGFYQDGIKNSLEPWNDRKRFRCDVYVTVGPQACHPDELFHGKGAPRTSSMRRTYDADAHDDPSYLRECIIHAFRASLSAMDNNSIEVAVVPGLSTGIYAPNKSEGAKLGGEMLSLLQRAIDGLQLSHLQRVIYCGPSGSGNNTYDTGSSKGGGSTGCRVPGCEEAHQKHYCRVCKDPDSNHFASNCPKA